MRAIGLCLVKGFIEDTDAAGLNKPNALAIGAEDTGVGLHGGGGENGLIGGADIVGGLVVLIMTGVGVGILRVDEVKPTGPDFILVCGHNVSLRVDGVHVVKCFRPGG